MRNLEVLDLFCGAGGTSTGAIEAAEECGYSPTLTAINHWPIAVATHTLNHPRARHLCVAADQVNPRELFRGRKLDLFWASPECTHHSNARGGMPINDQSRATAWDVVRLADALRPPVVLVENVPEFANWGLTRRMRYRDKAGRLRFKLRPDPERKGEIFQSWKGALEAIGYTVDFRVLCAADYGDPTTRRRLFVQAQLRGGRRKIVWPEATHGAGLRPYVAAREIIDWSLPCGSIYERKKALSEKTLARIFEGLRKFGLGPFNAPPFLVCMEHGGSVRSSDRPLPTITCAKGGAIGVAKPFLVELRGTSERQIAHTARSIDLPLPVVTAGGGHMALCEPALLPQQSDGRLRSVSEPAPTVAAAGAIALIEPFLVSYYGNGQAISTDGPLDTVTTKARFGLARPVVEFNGERYLLDIGFRMLQPHELALAQGFHEGYLFAGTKTDAVRQIGNAVPRRLARALVAAALTQRADVSGIIDRIA